MRATEAPYNFSAVSDIISHCSFHPAVLTLYLNHRMAYVTCIATVCQGRLAVPNGIGNSGDLYIGEFLEKIALLPISPRIILMEPSPVLPVRTLGSRTFALVDKARVPQIIEALAGDAQPLGTGSAILDALKRLAPDTARACPRGDAITSPRRYFGASFVSMAPSASHSSLPRRLIPHFPDT
jgi:hypothetical protein